MFYFNALKLNNADIYLVIYGLRKDIMSCRLVVIISVHVFAIGSHGL